MGLVRTRILFRVLIYIISGAVVILLVSIILLIARPMKRSRVQVDRAWLEIRSQIQHRLSLIPRLVEAMKAYAAHESEVFESLLAARHIAESSHGVRDSAEANRAVTIAVKSLFAATAAYPDLKANNNYRALQNELIQCEEKITQHRFQYNSSVTDYNKRITKPRRRTIARMFRHSTREFYTSNPPAVLV